MLRSLAIGVIAGQRAMTPLALAAGAARDGRLEAGPLPALLAHPAVAAGAVALAGAEMAGDKMRSAPDRTVAIGLLARGVTSAIAGAALAPAERRGQGALLATAAALASSYGGLWLRKRAMRRWSQTATGFVEDALLVAGGLRLVGTPATARSPAQAG
jgi:uncharacterized membrane protein